jgi:hypothetical protein
LILCALINLTISATYINLSISMLLRILRILSILIGPNIFLSICLLIGHQGAIFLGIKRPQREAKHSLIRSVEMRNKWSYTSALVTRLHGAYKDNFTFQELLETALKIIVPCQQ